MSDTLSVNLSNETAVQKQLNQKFKEYLMHTHTDFACEEKNKKLYFTINTTDKKRITAALDTYVFCTENGHIAYAH